MKEYSELYKKFLESMSSSNDHKKLLEGLMAGRLDPEEAEFIADTILGVCWNKQLTGQDREVMDAVTRYYCICEEDQYLDMDKRFQRTFGK